MPAVSSAAATDPGLRRSGNEDALCVRPDLGLFVVADGMGGHVAGEVASRLAVEAIEGFIERTKDAEPDGRWPVAYESALSRDANRIKTAIRLANRRVADAMQEDARLRGMATTVAAV